MTINYTTLLGLAKPVTGTEAGTWGDTVNDAITTLLEDAVANAATFSVTAGDVTLTSTAGQSNQARNALLIITGTPGVTRNVIAPSQSKVYIVKNGSDAAVVLKGSATTGVTIGAGSEALCFWNGSDFEIAGLFGPSSSTDNAIARFDSTTGKVIQNSSALVDDSGNVLAGAGLVGAPAFSTTGDTNTGIFFPAADTIAVSTSGTEVLRINSSQNVGIGISPSYRLDVYNSGSGIISRFSNGSSRGTVIVDGKTDASFNLYVNTSQVGYFQTDTGATELEIGSLTSIPLIFFTNNTDRGRFDTSGNLGIGTNSPATYGKFSVVGSESPSPIRFFAVASNGLVTSRYDDNGIADFYLQNYGLSNVDQGNRILFQLGTGATYRADAGGITVASNAVWSSTASTQDSYMAFSVALDGVLNQRMRITPTGNVGINTTNPTQTLAVQNATGTLGVVSSTGTNQSWMATNNTGGWVYLGRENSAGTAFGTTAYSSVVWSEGAYPLVFATNNTEKMRIDSSGNLCVGSTAAGNAGALNVSVGLAGTTAGGIQLWSNTTSSHSIQWGDGTSSTDPYRGYIEYAHTGDSMRFATQATERMRIDSNGNIGIGTISPLGSSISRAITINGSSSSFIRLQANGTTAGQLSGTSTQTDLACGEGGFLSFSTIAIGGSDTERMRLTSTGNFGVGTNDPNTYGRFSVLGTSTRYFAVASSALTTLRFDDNGIGDFYLNNWGMTGSGQGYRILWQLGAAGSYLADAGSIAVLGETAWNSTASTQDSFMQFSTCLNGTRSEKARISSEGNFLVGLTSSSITVVGTTIYSNGELNCCTSGIAPIAINRKASDGNLVRFFQDDVEEGNISVSGNTVSYNAFTGGHWSQLQEGRGYNPDILRGTVMSSIGEMAEWKSVTWTETIEHPAIPAVEAKEAVLDEEGNVVEPAVEAVEGKDAWTESIPHRDYYLGNLPVGATFEEDGFTKTVVDDGNERLPKVKISDVVGDKAVYGVFQTYDEVQDMLITSLGAFVVRIAAGVTVQIGDLLESNGDGCAKVQDDDVIRSKTIGKVTSTFVTDTYSDGSYTVPCVIYCG